MDEVAWTDMVRGRQVVYCYITYSVLARWLLLHLSSLHVSDRR